MTLLWSLFFITTLVFHLASPAPAGLQAFEQSMLANLHKPWLVPDKKEKPEYPRKGEPICKGKHCKKMPVPACEDCQYAVPIFSDDVLEKFRPKEK